MMQNTSFLYEDNYFAELDCMAELDCIWPLSQYMHANIRQTLHRKLTHT